MPLNDLNFTGYENVATGSIEEMVSHNWIGRYEEGVAKLIRISFLDEKVDVEFREQVLDAARALVDLAYSAGDGCALYSLQKSLFYLYNQHVESPSGDVSGNQYSPFLLSIRQILEDGWMAFENSRLPVFPDYEVMGVKNFSSQIKSLWQSHKAYSHEIFSYMELYATKEEVCFYICSDYALNVRFYDLISLSLVAAPEVTRVEVANNYWDEMGNGDVGRTHIQLFRHVLESIGSQKAKHDYLALLGASGLAGYNLLLKQVLSRGDYFRSIGSLAITELADPQQYVRFLNGCKRVGIYSDKFEYYSEHIDIDALHGEAWVDNVIVPMAAAYPECRKQIIEGCYLRLNSSVDYWDEVMNKMRDL